MSENASTPVQQTELSHLQAVTLDARVGRLEEQNETLGQQIAHQAECINTLCREVEYLKQASYGMQHQAFMQQRTFKPGAEARPYAHPAGVGLFELDRQFHREQFSTPEIGTAQLLTRLLENQWSSNVLVEWLHELYTRVYCSKLRALEPSDYVQITHQLQGLINQKTKRK